MGDRGNVYVAQHPGPDAGPEGVYLYTHWGGSHIARKVQCALLRAADRWTDEHYLGRVIFNEMTAGAESATVGFGISTYLTDNEHEILTVDAASQAISFADPNVAPRVTYTFAEFAKLDLVAAQLVPSVEPCMAVAPVSSTASWGASRERVIIVGIVALAVLVAFLKRVRIWS